VLTLDPAELSPGPALGARPWGVPAVAAALTLPLLFWALALGLSGSGETDLTDGEVAAALIGTIIFDLALIGIAAGVCLWRYRLGWAELGLRPFASDLWWLPLVAAATAHASVIVYALVFTAVGADEAAPRQEDLEELFGNRAVLPLAGVATVIVAPVAEEIFFRGFVFAGLLRRLGAFGAMAASGLVFGTFHVAGVDTLGLVIPFTAIGMGFAWLYYRTGSLWPSILTHLVFNLVSFVLLASLGTDST